VTKVSNLTIRNAQITQEFTTADTKCYLYLTKNF